MSTTPDMHGLRVARQFARFHIGDPDWANMIIQAYLNPDEEERILAEEMFGD